MGNCTCVGEQDQSAFTIETRENPIFNPPKTSADTSSPNNYESELSGGVTSNDIPQFQLDLPAAEIQRIDLIEDAQELIPEKGIVLHGTIPDILSPKVRSILNSLDQFDYSTPVAKVIKKDPVQLPDGSIYDGEWYQNSRFGRGKLYSIDGSFQEGYWKNSFLHYKGRYIYTNGDYYQGEYCNGTREGKGELVSTERLSSYTGDWKDDKQHGNGVENFQNGVSYYEGEFQNGLKNGEGFFKWEDGSEYKGHFKNNTLEGEGRYRWNDQREYIGTWLDNKMHGRGIFTWPDGREYVGEYKLDKKEGHGVHKWTDGKIYDGEWKDGKMHGLGFLTYPDKERKQYRFVKGKKRKGEEP